MAQILIPPNLLKFTKSKKSVDVDAKDLSEALDQLFKSYPDLKDRILTDTGKVQRYMKIFIDGSDSQFAGGLASPLTEKSVIKILTALAGG